MPLKSPNLDDRNFEELLEETKRRIPAHTPEWTNFQVESDPGITLIQLFAFLTDSLLYRANRVPELNRAKFLQLLGVPMHAASAAQGIITIANRNGGQEPPTLPGGIKVTAGRVEFITRDSVSALPLEVLSLYKRRLDLAPSDPLYVEWQAKYEAIWTAKRLAGGSGVPPQPPTPVFYETQPLPQPSASDPNPVLDLSSPEIVDNALYVALLAPKDVRPADVRTRIAGKTLSIGIVPAVFDAIEPASPGGRRSSRAPVPRLVYEIPDASAPTAATRYRRLLPALEPDVLGKEGIVQVKLPAAVELGHWDFAEPQEEGTDNYPPLIEDQAIHRRLVTWIRLRAPSTPAASGPDAAALPTTPAVEGVLATKLPKARISWVGINAVRVAQAVAVPNELLVGTSNGEPNQEFTLSNTPVIARSVRLEVETASGSGSYESWHETDDLLSAAMDDRVFSVDPESGGVRFGTGLRGARPPAGRRIRATYQYGGGRQGNVPIGAINGSPDPRWPAGLKLSNPLATWGGDEGETVAEAERNIPLVLRHRNRLVTERDFAEVARRIPGVDVGRVDVLPLFRPGGEDQADQDEAAGVVTLLVLPKFDPVSPLWPQPDRLFLQTVCDYLAPRRLVTTELHVRGPVYVPIYLSVGVQIDGGHFPDLVLQGVRERLNEYLSALGPSGLIDEERDGWPLRKALVKKDLEAVVTRVSGVNFVTSMELGVQDQRGIDDHPLVGLQLPKLVALQVREGQAEPLAAVLEGVDSAGPHVDVFPVPVNRLNC